MDSDDRDAESPPKKDNLLRRAASLLTGRSKSEQSTDSLEISENYTPFGAKKGEIEELGSGSSNPDLLKKTGSGKSADSGSMPTVSDLMKKIYTLNHKPDADDLVELTAGMFKDVSAVKSRKNRSLPATSENMEAIDLNLDEVRPALLANLELGHDVAIAPNDEDMFPDNHDGNPCLTGAGLRNLGSTCFMNSVLQCLVHTVPLYEAVLSENNSLRCTCKFGQGFCLSCFMRMLFISSTSGRSAIAPLTLAGNLRYISDRFSRYKQDDAHEFLLHIWTRLTEYHDYVSPNESIIRTVFGGIINSKFTCHQCKKSFKKAEEIYDMQLPIQNDSELTFAILSYTKGEVDYSCESCGMQEGATQEVKFCRLPSIATFQLKRFGNRMNKIEKHVSFPLLLDMRYFTKLDEEDLTYQLYAVIVHEGSTLKGGHYYCFIQISPDEWIRFDDARVSKVNQNEVLSQQAYILFYAKPGTPWFSDSVQVQKSSTASTSSQHASTSAASQIGASTSSQAPASDIDDGKNGAPASDIGGGSRGVRLASTEEESKSGYHSFPLSSIKEKDENR